MKERRKKEKSKPKKEKKKVFSSRPKSVESSGRKKGTQEGKVKKKIFKHKKGTHLMFNLYHQAERTRLSMSTDSIRTSHGSVVGILKRLTPLGHTGALLRIQGIIKLHTIGVLHSVAILARNNRNIPSGITPLSPNIEFPPGTGKLTDEAFRHRVYTRGETALRIIVDGNKRVVPVVHGDLLSDMAKGSI